MHLPIPTRIDWRGVPVRQRWRTEDESPQLGLPFYGKTVDVDKLCDPKYPEGIQYWGKATHVFDNVYRCLANVGGTLCVVEVTISPHALRSPET